MKKSNVLRRIPDQSIPPRRHCRVGMGETHSKKVFPSYVSWIVQMKLDPFVSVCRLFVLLLKERAWVRPTCCKSKRMPA